MQFGRSHIERHIMPPCQAENIFYPIKSSYMKLCKSIQNKELAKDYWLAMEKSNSLHNGK